MQKYLKNRGIIKTSDTGECNLVSKVFHASQLHLPLCSTKEQEETQTASRRKEKLFIDGISLYFPMKLADCLKESQHFPNMMMTEIEAYLSEHNDRKSVKEGKISMKAGCP